MMFLYHFHISLGVKSGMKCLTYTFLNKVNIFEDFLAVSLTK